MRDFIQIGLVLVLGTGCRGEEVFWLEAGDFQTVLVLRGPFDPGTAQIEGLEGRALRLEVEAEEELILLRYRATLAELQMEPGTFPIPETGRRIPKPDEALAWRGDRLSAFMPGEFNLDASRIPWPGDDPCLDIELEQTIEISDVPFGATTVLPLSPDRVLLVSTVGRFHELSLAGELRRLEELDGLPTDGAYADASSNEVWLVSGKGVVVRGHPDRGFQNVSSSTKSLSLTSPLYVDGA